ncbi:hypothetical protein ACA910_022435 [Epithemia clementina (nom. ined.)]
MESSLWLLSALLSTVKRQQVEKHASIEEEQESLQDGINHKHDTTVSNPCLPFGNNIDPKYVAVERIHPTSSSRSSNNSKDNSNPLYKPAAAEDNDLERPLVATAIPAAITYVDGPLLFPANHGYKLDELVDNSQLVYLPVRLRRSNVLVRVRPPVLAQCPEILVELDNDLYQCLHHVLPRSVHGLVRRTQVWINHTYIYGPQRKPIVLNHSTAHYDPNWLMSLRDRPEKALGIEIYNCFDFRRMRMHWNGCGLILHEICHLLHLQVLPGGLANEQMLRLFEIAQQPPHALFHPPHQHHISPHSNNPNLPVRGGNCGLYAETIRRDWAGQHVETDQHYATVDHKEFFAELSVTYLASEYQHLDHIPLRLPPYYGRRINSVIACSPPILEPNVLARIAAATSGTSTSYTNSHSSYNNPHNVQQQGSHAQQHDCQLPQFSSKNNSHYIPRAQQVQRRPFDLLPPPKNQLMYPHCNKFYPFTRGQLRQHDPQTYAAFHYFWKVIIAQWKDPDQHKRGGSDEKVCCCWFTPWTWQRKVNAVS